MTQFRNINLLLRADVSMGSSSSTKRSPWCCYLQIFSLMDNWQEGRSLASKAALVPQQFKAQSVEKKKQQ